MNLEVQPSKPQRADQLLSGFQPKRNVVGVAAAEMSPQRQALKEAVKEELRKIAKERREENAVARAMNAADQLQVEALRGAINPDVSPENRYDGAISYGSSDVQDFSPTSSHPGPLVMRGDPKYALPKKDTASTDDLNQTRRGFPPVE